MTGYAMQISSAAIALIKKQQGLSLEKYRDEKGIWVIGYGHVIRQWEKFNGLITPTEAENLLCNDIQLCEALLREMNKRPLTQQQHDALILTLFSFGEESPSAREDPSGRRPGVVHRGLRPVFDIKTPEKRLKMGFYRCRTDIEITSNLFIGLSGRQ